MMPIPKATPLGGFHWLVGLGLTLSAACIGLPLPRAIAVDATTRAIQKVMEENLAASDAEDLPRLMKTMSRETPNPERFIRETLKEWAAADTSTHLIKLAGCGQSDPPLDSAAHTPEKPRLFRGCPKWKKVMDDFFHGQLEVLKRSHSPYARVRLPYATVRIVQEMRKSERSPGSEEPSELSRNFGLDQEHPVVEFETLWKREGGKWRLVAAITAPQPYKAMHDQP